MGSPSSHPFSKSLSKIKETTELCIYLNVQSQKHIHTQGKLVVAVLKMQTSYFKRTRAALSRSWDEHENDQQ